MQLSVLGGTRRCWPGAIAAGPRPKISRRIVVRRRPDIAGSRMRPIIRRRRVVQSTNAEQSPDTDCLGGHRVA